MDDNKDIASDGAVNLLRRCKADPEWAASRITALEALVEGTRGANLVPQEERSRMLRCEYVGGICLHRGCNDWCRHFKRGVRP